MRFKWSYRGDNLYSTTETQRQKKTHCDSLPIDMF